MVTYEAFDPNVEINGQTVLTIVEEAMGLFSDDYRTRALDALAEEGISEPATDEWYPQQAWLNAFETIAYDLQPHVLDRLGEALPDVAEWPNNFNDVSTGIQSIGKAYERNHRGGEIGSYEYEEIDGQTGIVTCDNPYPCQFDRGLIRGVAQKYAPVDSFVFVEETGETCRRDGDDTCTYTVHW